MSNSNASDKLNDGHRAAIDSHLSAKVQEEETQKKEEKEEEEEEEEERAVKGTQNSMVLTRARDFANNL